MKIPSGASIEATVGRVGKAGKTYVVTASVETGGTCAIEKDGVAGPTLAAGENQMAKVVSSADFMFMAHTEPPLDGRSAAPYKITFPP